MRKELDLRFAGKISEGFRLFNFWYGWVIFEVDGRQILGIQDFGFGTQERLDVADSR
jgi:hypothetical protein